MAEDRELSGTPGELESATSYVLLQRDSHWNGSSDLIAWWRDRKGGRGRGWCRCVVSTDTRRSTFSYRTIVDAELDVSHLTDLQNELVGLGALELDNQDESLSSLDFTYEVAIKVDSSQEHEHSFRVVGGVHVDARFTALLDRILEAEPKLLRFMKARRQQGR